MDWKTLLKKRGLLVTDGAMGTQLTERGLPTGTAPEFWNLENPDAVEAVARAYVEAGADIILTNTFGGNRFKLEKAGLSDRTAEINRRATEISRRAAGDKVLVFASIGPTGDFMAPLGTKTEAEFIDCFAEQIGASAEAGADGIVIETMTALEEAMAALKAARQVSDLPAVVSMTYDRGPKGFATMMGVAPERAAAELDQAGADAIGANCGSGADNAAEVTRRLRAATGKPVWIKPNAGLPELVDGQTVFRETPEETAGKIPAIVEAGANIVGGCCGTTPEHIRKIAEAVRNLRESRTW